MHMTWSYLDFFNLNCFYPLRIIDPANFYVWIRKKFIKNQLWAIFLIWMKWNKSKFILNTNYAFLFKILGLQLQNLKLNNQNFVDIWSDVIYILKSKYRKHCTCTSNIPTCIGISITLNECVKSESTWWYLLKKGSTTVGVDLLPVLDLNNNLAAIMHRNLFLKVQYIKIFASKSCLL
jgi:hypothetical protein